MSDVDSVLAKLCRNAIEVIDKSDLKARLEEGKPLRIKAGFDPSAPDIHLGHTVLLRKLREFQDFGHQVVFIIGDYTAMIGDPTGQSKTRPALSKEEVEKNAKTYQAQAFKILDKDPKKIEVVKNSDWLGKLSLKDFLETVATRFTIAQILERDDFEKRMAENQPVSLREFVYPLLQAYDSVMVKADVELGGTDQKFNLMAGRDLQRNFSQRPQVVMTFPLLVGLDGTNKMSKSLKNYIGITDSAKDVFGKAMSIPDALMASYFNLLTQENGDEIQREVAQGKLHPRDAKVMLARILTDALHGGTAAERESLEFERVFSQRQMPDKAEEISCADPEIWICKLLTQAHVTRSNAEARRLVEQGGVEVDGKTLTDPKANVLVGSTVKAGKKRVLKIVR